MERLKQYELKLKEIECWGSIYADADKKNEALNDVYKSIHMQEVSAPVFAVSAAEHFINLYACSRIESFYTSEHLESLDLFSKWIVIPYIICGEEIDRESQAARDFKHMISVRNSLIHAKPSYIHFNNPEIVEKRYNKLDAKKRDRKKVARRSAMIVIGMFSELKKIDPSEDLIELMEELGITVDTTLTS